MNLKNSKPISGRRLSAKPSKYLKKKIIPEQKPGETFQSKKNLPLQ